MKRNKKDVLLKDVADAFKKHIVPILDKYLEPNNLWEHGWWMMKDGNNKIFINGIEINVK